MKVESVNVALETIFTFGADEVLSCLYFSEETRILIVGTCNGAVFMVLPKDCGVHKDGGKAGVEVVVQDAQENDGTEKDVDKIKLLDSIELDELECSCARDSGSWEYVMVKSRSNEAVRTAYIDDTSGKLYTTSGDAGVHVFDLNNLQLADELLPDDAKNEKYAFDRIHSFGTCVNSYILQYKLEIVLGIRNSTAVYSMKFPEETEEAEEQGENSPTGNGRLVDRLKEAQAACKRVEPVQKEISLSTSSNAIPIHFDGDNLIILKREKTREFQVDIRDWSTDDLHLVNTIKISAGVFNQLSPYSVQSCGDALFAVVNFTDMTFWNISSGQVLFGGVLKGGHARGTKIIAARLCRPDLLVSLGADRSVVVWDQGRPIQRIKLPSKVCHFILDGPYFLEPIFDDKVLVRLWFNDDTGVHHLTV